VSAELGAPQLFVRAMNRRRFALSTSSGPDTPARTPPAAPVRSPTARSSPRLAAAPFSSKSDSPTRLQSRPQAQQQKGKPSLT